MTKTDTPTEKLGALTGLAVSAFIMSCLRGWLLSLCAAFFFPTFALGFWQWVLVAFTFRLFVSGPSSND